VEYAAARVFRAAAGLYYRSENLQIRVASVITRAPAARLIKGCRGGGEVLKSMIPKSGYRFSEKIMLKCN
jgi:hypothetical protein